MLIPLLDQPAAVAPSLDDTADSVTTVPGDDLAAFGINPILMFACGSEADESDWKRKLGWDIEKGWFNSHINKFLDDYAEEFRSRGLPFRLLLHSPWGLNADEVMDFDQRVEASQNPHMQLAIESFVPWLEQRVRPLVEETGGELIIYLGSGPADQDMKALENQPLAYLNRLAESIADVPDWASLALDNTSYVKETDPFWTFIESQQNFGRKLYVEARPFADSAVVGFPTITESTFWSRSDPERFSDSKWAATNAEVINGDPSQILLYTLQNSSDARWNDYQRIIDQGHTPLVDYRDLSWVLDMKPSSDSTITPITPGATTPPSTTSPSEVGPTDTVTVINSPLSIQGQFATFDSTVSPTQEPIVGPSSNPDTSLANLNQIGAYSTANEEFSPQFDLDQDGQVELGEINVMAALRWTPSDDERNR